MSEILPFASKVNPRALADVMRAEIEAEDMAGTHWLVWVTTARDGSAVTVFIQNSEWPDIIFDRFTAATAQDAFEMAWDWALSEDPNA